MNDDGTCVLHSGTHDMGNGQLMVQIQVVAETLGIPPERVACVASDTDVCGWNLGDFSSRGVYVSCGAVQKAAEDAAVQLRCAAAGLLDGQAEDISLHDGRAWLPEGGSASLAEVMNYAQSVQKHEIFGVATHASAHTPGSYGVHMARVKVEKATGAVTVTDYIAVHDVGRVMNRMGIEGQLEGGIQMGLGYALREELAFDAAGQLRDSSLHSYRPFRATEMPRLQTDFIEEGEPTGPYGAKSISECAVVPSAPAIINAVCDATGLDIHDLPYRPIKAEGGIRRLHTTEGCVFCGLCVKKCPYGALSVDRQTKQWRVSDRRCRECGLCAAACPKHCLSLDNSVV